MKTLDGRKLNFDECLVVQCAIATAIGYLAHINGSSAERIIAQLTKALEVVRPK